MAIKMQQRRGTAAEWTSANPVLAPGEIGLETDTGRFKIGDGAKLWNDTLLKYYSTATDLQADITATSPVVWTPNPQGLDATKAVISFDQGAQNSTNDARYVKLTGPNVVVTAGVNDVPVTINAITSQVGNLQNWQVNSVAKAEINKDGTFTTVSNINTTTTDSTGTLGNVNASRIRLGDVTDASTTSTRHALQIGPDTGADRLVLDSNEIHVYNGSTPATLTLNADGGTVAIANASAAATTTINGPLITATGTSAIAPLRMPSGATLTTATAGVVEYDGSFFYATQDATSGRGAVSVNQAYRLTSNVTAFGTAIGDFYGATSSINLAASSVYEIEFFAYFLKTTAGTATFTLTASSAPTQITGYYIGSGITGINVAAAPTTGYIGSAAATTAAFAATGSLTTAVNHAYRFNVTVITNAATTFKLQLTQSAGTATPLAGSYYKVNKVSGTQGSFA